MSAKIMVTGGGGFLGAHIVRHLADRGDQVLIYDLVPPSGERAWLIKGAKGKVEFERRATEDLSSLFSVMRDYRIEKVVHCAAVIDVSYLNQNPLTALRINVIGTINVLEAARLLQIGRVVVASSNAVLTVKQYEPIDENHPVLLPEGPALGFYGALKMLVRPKKLLSRFFQLWSKVWMCNGYNCLCSFPPTFAFKIYHSMFCH